MGNHRKPDFIIIGAAKSGTSSLYSQLAKHPDIFMSTKKETQFFSNDTNFAKGLEWYENFFIGSDQAKAVGEATPSYTSRTENSKTAKRIHDTLPNAKLIYIVRHPLGRIESFWKPIFMKNPDMEINRFVKDEAYKPYCIDRSKYWFQISAYREYFNDDQILVLFFEDFKANPEETLKQIFRFIGVDENAKIQEAGKVYNKTSRADVQLSSGFSKARKIPGYAFIRDLLPQKLRDKIMKGTGLKKEIMVQDPQWEDETRKWVISQLEEEAKTFLEFYGKPADFWTFQK